jgi:membrane-associated protease RseP (regulator of RpoE activity)
MRTILLAVSLATAAAAPLNAQIYYTSVTPRGWLGISFSQIETSVNGGRTSAVVINDVTDNSPAKRAGVQRGDTLLRVNDFRASSDLLGSMGSSVEPGDTVRFVVKRGGRERDIAIVVAERPANMTFTAPAVTTNGFSGRFMIDPDSVRGRTKLFVDSIYATIDTAHFRTMFRFDTINGFRTLVADSVFFATPGRVFQYGLGDSVRAKWSVHMDSVMNGRLFEFASPGGTFNFDSGGHTFTTTGYLLGARAFGGADLIDLNRGLSDYFGAKDGVLVVRVPDGSPADRAGLEAGDVITKVDGTEVRSAKALREAAERVAPRAPIRLTAVRHGKTVNLELKRD